ncbi:MAG: redoxin domain-containing protein [Phycisphaerales bacterium]
MQRLTVFAAALALCAGSTAYAQDYAPTEDAQVQDAKKLTIGDNAPPIDIAHWIKGDKIEEFETGKVYVVEFWATWCGPCRASMPHLSKLQEQYTDYDVTFVGVSDEDLQTVISFLFKEDKKDGKINNDRTRYTLTADPDKSVMNDYFRAAGQRGIPCAFIIGKDTKVEWIGHPMQMDEPLESVVKDTWDRDEFKTKFQRDRQTKEKLMERQKQLAAAIGAEDWATAVELSWDSALGLNEVAWKIVDDANVKNRDLDVALEAAKRATDLSERKDAAILDTFARVFYERGDVKSALKWQRLAAENLKGAEPFADDVRKALKKYQQEVDSEI